MDGICHPQPKFPWLPYALWALGSVWLLCPGFGMIANGAMKEGGMCIKTIAIGFVLNCLSWFGLFWGWFLLPLILPLVAWVFGGYHGYVVYNKSK